MTEKQSKNSSSKKGFYVFSTLSTSTAYTVYKKQEKGMEGINRVESQVVIKGGANVVDKKHLVTPKGVMTEVTEEEMKVLEENPIFKIHVEKGFIKTSRVNEHPDRVSKDMTKKDATAPKTPGELKEMDEAARAEK